MANKRPVLGYPHTQGIAALRFAAFAMTRLGDV